MTGEQSFPRVCRVRRQADYERAYATGAVAADDVLVLHGSRNALPHARLGLSVSRKVGPAVVRNRWKRLIREAFRQQRAELPAGYDFVVRPRRGAEPDFEAIMRSLPRLTRRLTSRLAKDQR